jgi:hypothetical protein
MIEYTQENLWELAARMPGYRRKPVADVIRGTSGIDDLWWIIDVEHIWLISEGKHINLTPYDCIPKHKFLRYLLYTKSLEDMPLYINDPAYMCCIIATWRLSIAK